MTDLRHGLEQLACRGEPRGAEQVVAASVLTAERRLAPAMEPSPRRRRGLVGALGAVVVVGLVIGVVALRSAGRDVHQGVQTPTHDVTLPRGVVDRVAWVDGQGLVVASAANPKPRAVAQGQVCCSAWSVDGRLLAYLQGGALRVVRADGTHDQQIAESVDTFEWSPRASAIAWKDTGGALYIADTATTASSRVPTQAVDDFAWSHDGKSLAVASHQIAQPHGNLEIVAVDQLTPPQVVPFDGSAFAPACEGTYTLFVAGWAPADDGVLVWVDDCGSGSISQDGLHLVIVPINGDHVVDLGRTLVKRSWVQWSPDGQRVAIVRSSFRSVDAGDRTVTICDREAACTPLSGGDRQTMDPAWSPDGRQLAYVQRPSTSESPPVRDGRPQWRSLYQSRRLWIADADGNGAHEITAAGDGVANPAWSSDGNHLFYIQGDAFWSVDTSTDQTTRIVAPVEPVPAIASYGQTNPAPPDAPYEPGPTNQFPTWESLVSWLGVR